MLFDQKKTPREHVTHALTLINPGKLLGTVLNVGPVSKRTSYERYSEYRNPHSTSSRRQKNELAADNAVLPAASKDKVKKSDNNQAAKRVPEKNKEIVEKAPKEVFQAIAKTEPTNGDLKKQAGLQKSIPRSDKKPQRRASRENDTRFGSDFSVTKIREYLGSKNGKGVPKNDRHTPIGEKAYGPQKAYIRMILDDKDGKPYADKRLYDCR